MNKLKSLHENQGEGENPRVGGRFSGKSDLPIILIHSGAGLKNRLHSERVAANEKIAQQAWDRLASGTSALDTVAFTLSLLEQDPFSNAGVGSDYQRDGVPRLSASIMDGSKKRFSSVALVTEMANPSKLALELQERRNTNLGPYGAQLLCRELGIKPTNAFTEHVSQKWLKDRLSNSKPDGHGTVGVVVIDSSGKLAAGTSTGGGGVADFPERMSDVNTVAGNYATEHAAISATGIGEEIVNDAIAAALNTRVKLGITVIEASNSIFKEAINAQRSYGWIALDSLGNWSANFTTEAMVATVVNSSGLKPLSTP